MNTAQTTKNLAQKIAKQIAQEPLEILKDARQQVTGEQLAGKVDNSILGEKPTEKEFKSVEEQNQKLQDEVKSQRLMAALERELKDINLQNLFKDLQYKISQGIEVYLEEYPELSVDQKQVLNAQIEAMSKQKQMANQQSKSSLPFLSSKPSRRFGAGQKREAEKQQTRVEKPVPPSG